MNLNNLIQKVIEIDLEKNKNYFEKIIVTATLSSFFLPFSLLLLMNYSFEYSFIFSLIFYLSIFLLFFIIDFFSLFNKYKISMVLFDKFIKKLGLKEEEKNTIKEYTFSYDFALYKKDQANLLDHLIQKNISTIDYQNMEEFLNILKNNNLIDKYLPILFDKIIEDKNSIQIVYTEPSLLNTINFSKEELLLATFLNKTPELKSLIIEKIYANCSLDEMINNKNFLNELTIENIANKILASYTLKEIIHSLFFNSNVNNIFYKIEISNIFNLLHEENSILIKKLFIEKVLEEKDKSLIEYCYTEFFNSSFNLNLKNKNELYDLKSQFSEEQLAFNDNLKIIHI